MKNQINARLLVHTADGSPRLHLRLPSDQVSVDREEAQQLRDALTCWLFQNGEANGAPVDGVQERQVIVMHGDLEDNGPPLVLLGMSQASWDYCKDGMSHSFDLTKVGIPIRLVVAGGPTQAAIVETFQRGATMSGATFEDQRKKLPTVGIDNPTSH